MLEQSRLTLATALAIAEPASPGFDWTSAIIGAAAGLALAVLAGGAVGGGRVRHGRAGTA